MSHIQFWPSCLLLLNFRTTKLILSFLILIISVAQVALADVIPEINRQPAATIIQGYEKECSDALGGDVENGLTISVDATFQMTIDENDTSATVLISDFSCGDLSPMWCGSGGCDTHLFVNGKVFVWRVSWAPFSIQIPTYSKPRTVLLFPLSGGYCRTASEAPRSTVMSGCYAIASWDKQRETFITTVNGLQKVGLGKAHDL